MAFCPSILDDLSSRDVGLPQEHSPYTASPRRGTGLSQGSSDGTHDIIPGGAFEGFDLGHSSCNERNHSSQVNNMHLLDTVNLPQTPQHRSMDGYGCGTHDESTQFGFATHGNPQVNDGGVSSAIRNIDERTKRINMASSPSSCTPMKGSPSAMQAMHPSAFRMTATPVSPIISHSPTASNVPNGTTQPRPIAFALHQPVINFTSGPPLQHYSPQIHSYSSSIEAQPSGLLSSRESHFSYSPTGINSSSSPENSMFTSSSTAGYPSTPVQHHIRSSYAYGNTISPQVKLEDGTEHGAIFGQDLPTVQQSRFQYQQQYPPATVGSMREHVNQRQYHPYRSSQSEPLNRVASISMSYNYPPPTPPIFAFSQPFPPSNSHSVSMVQSQDVFASPTSQTGIVNVTGRHQHTGSLQFAVPGTPVTFGNGGSLVRPPAFQSMSLPNHPGLGFPTSPEGGSVQSEIDGFDEDAGRTARRPSALTLAGDGLMLQQSPKSPKKHVCQLCGKAFNRPSSLNTHLSVHTGAKPYQCPKRDCGRKFSVSSNLRRHMKTHEIKDQKRVAQMSARELADLNHFDIEEEPKVKEEPVQDDNTFVHVELQEEDQELVNGSIVFDENGQAYRYYASESEYQAAHRQLDASQQVSTNSEAAQAPVLLCSEDLFAKNTAQSSFPLQFRLGNAAPPMEATMTSASPPETDQQAPGFGSSWNRAGEISEGVSLPRPLALGNAGFMM